MPTTTRTLNPLPFSSLEPRRFEDLIRQLAYDFRRWRMLEATGRAGSDDGYDARGYEITGGIANEPQEVRDIDDVAVTFEPATDNLWLIQCKRERAITPAKIKLHLSEIPEAEARKVYGVIFTAACDFSKKTRDVALSWARDHGISEIHIWGKAEVEDQLFQPKNDHLLFAYFGISLQIRRRSMACARFRRHRVSGVLMEPKVRVMERRKFTREFKLEAVRLIEKQRRIRMPQASHDLSVRRSQLRSWVRALADDPQHAFPGQGQIEARAAGDRASRARGDAG